MTTLLTEPRLSDEFEDMLLTPFPAVFSSPTATVLADSISYEGTRLVTVESKHALPIWQEILTHRSKSRNSGSSRAVPVAKRVRQVLTDPFVPDRFPLAQKGMQPGGYTEAGTELHERAAQRWLDAARRACRTALEFDADGIHKEIANRVLHPFLWNNAVLSATDWRNFMALRCHSAAQRQVRQAAEVIRAAMAESTPTLLAADQWHLPLTGFPGDEALSLAELIKVSIGRCARTSYLTHDGRRDTDADIELYERLQIPPREQDEEDSPPHLSPFEHAAHPDHGRHGNFDGWKQARQYVEQGQPFVPHRNGVWGGMPPALAVGR